MKCPNECGITKIIRQYDRKRVSHCESCKIYICWFRPPETQAQIRLNSPSKWTIFKILKQDSLDEEWGRSGRCSRRSEVNRVYETRIDCSIGPGGA